MGIKLNPAEPSDGLDGREVTMTEDPIVRFYSGGVDDRGRTLDDILAASDRELEAAHDCIQWLFPTSGRSRFNPGAPLVTGDTAGAFESRPELRDRLRRALDRMLAFYGLRRKPAGEAGSEIVIDDARFAGPRWAGVARFPRCRTCA
jgi:hypothetical protein